MALAQFKRLAASNKKLLDSLVGLPLIARGLPKSLAIERSSGTPLGVVEYDPWQAGHRTPSDLSE